MRAAWLNYSIFVWDHTNMDLGNATEPYRALFADDSVPLSMLVKDHDFAEFEIARDAKRVLETQMPGSLAASADEADVVLVALWPYGLCMLNVSGQTVGMEDWQTEKGILAAGTCPEVQAAYSTIVTSDRFVRRDGRDFAFIADKVTKMLEGWNAGGAYRQLVNRSVLVGVEERRLTSDIGRSRHLPVPYYVDPQKWYLESDDGKMALRKDGSQRLGKGNFIAYWGSRHVGEHCPACSSGNDPQEVRGGPMPPCAAVHCPNAPMPQSMHQCINAPMHQCTNAPMHQCIDASMHRCTDVTQHPCHAPMPQCTNAYAPMSQWQVRGGLIDQLVEGCEADGKQCKIVVSEDESNRNTFLDDADLTFEAEMASAVFCPVPRGDSAATKRFYCALASLCIPVVVSDHFPFPFAETVDYASFVIRYSEADIAARTVDVFHELASMDPARVRQMQLAMASARHEVLYTRGRLTDGSVDVDAPAVDDIDAWQKGRAVLNVMDELRRLPACHQSSLPAADVDGGVASTEGGATTSEGCDRKVVGGTFEGCISCKPKLEQERQKPQEPQ